MRAKPETFLPHPPGAPVQLLRTDPQGQRLRGEKGKEISAERFAAPASGLCVRVADFEALARQPIIKMNLGTG